MSLMLSPDELRDLTGYSQPSRVLAELRRQGFYRARRAPITGRVILERAHYDAVCNGQDRPAAAPKLRTPTLSRPA